MKNRITILGDGGWGTTLSILLHRKNYKVCLWGAFKEYIEFLRKERENKKFLKGVRIPKKIYITFNLKEALSYSKTIIIAIPSQFLRGVLVKIKQEQLKDCVFLSATKGIEQNSLKRMSEVIYQELGKVHLAVLSGPNIAQEIARGKPAVSTVASKEKQIAYFFQNLLMHKNFRVYTNDDVIGTELGGSLKNIIALACGICDGLNLGTNAKAALLSRGLMEISRLGVSLGAKRETFFGISGVGDLVTTCISPYSRNRFVGEQIAKGKTVSRIVKNMQMVAEGIHTTMAAYKLARNNKVEMPITREIYYVLYKHKSPKKAVGDLMCRRKKPEY